MIANDLKILTGLFRFLRVGVLTVATLCCGNCHAQQKVIDSLTKLLPTLPDDTTKVLVLHALSYNHWMTDLKKSEAFGLEGLALAEKLEYTRGIGKLSNVLGVTYSRSGDVKRGLIELKKSEKIFLKLGARELGSVYNNLGITYNDLGLYIQAIDYLLKAVKVNEDLGLPDETIANQVNLGNAYMNIDNDSMALSHFIKALKLTRNSQTISHNDRMLHLGMAYENLAAVFLQLKNLDSATFYAKKGIGLKTDLSPSTVAYCYAHLADVAIEQQNYRKALTYVHQADSIYKYLQESMPANNVDIMAAEIYQELGNFPVSIKYAKASLDEAQRSAWLKNVARAANVLFRDYAALDNYDSAYKYRMVHMAAQDSLFNKDKDNEIIALQASFDLEKKEMETRTLQKENRIQRLTALLISVILAFASWFAYLFIREYRREKKMRIQQDEKNMQIAKQHDNLKEALASLKHAQLQLIHSERMASLGLLTAGIAHEINNPVNFIFGGVQVLEEYVEKLKKNNGREQALSAVETMTQNIKQSVSKITDIVTVLKLFTSPGNRMVSQVDLRSCLESTLTILKNELNDHIRVLKDYHDIPRVSCNPAQINQVFFHLIHNAVQALDGNPVTGEIHLRTFTGDGLVVVSIRDNGPGIAEEVQAQWFGEFFPTTKKEKSSGLGFSISHNIIKEHGGTLEFKTSGIGTEFIIKLPAR